MKSNRASAGGNATHRIAVQRCGAPVMGDAGRASTCRDWAAGVRLCRQFPALWDMSMTVSDGDDSLVDRLV